VHVVAFDPPAGPSWGRHSQAAGSSTMPHTYQYPKVTPLPKPKPADSTAW
jgi:hypothetical protein